MLLYLLRHGIAEDATGGMRDEDRRLTAEGREKLHRTLRLASAAGVHPATILTSPLVRAVQTAEIAAEELGYGGEIVRTDALAPEADPEQLWSEVRALRGEPSLLLASHNPLCSRAAGYLLGQSGLEVDFDKGGLLFVKMQGFGPTPRGVLRWLLSSDFGLS